MYKSLLKLFIPLSLCLGSISSGIVDQRFFYLQFILMLIFYPIKLSDVVSCLKCRNITEMIFIIMNIVLIFIYLDDLRSFFNLVAVFFTSIVISTYVNVLTKEYGLNEFLTLLKNGMLNLCILGLVLGYFGTILGLPGAPEENIFAEISLGKDRIADGSIGYAGIGYGAQIGFFLALFNRNKKYKNAFEILLFLGIIILSGNRTGLLLTFFILMTYLFWRVNLSTKVAFIYFSAILLFSVLVLTGVNWAADLTEYLLEKFLIFVGSSRINNDALGLDFSTGRIALNTVMLENAFKSPIVGVGNSSELLNTIYDMNGKPSDFGAMIESPFRLIVKYGWPYGISLLLMVFSSSSALLKNSIAPYYKYLILGILFVLYFQSINGSLVESGVGVGSLNLLLIFVVNYIAYDRKKTK